MSIYTDPNVLHRTHLTTLQSGIRRTREFERKGLAKFGVNAGAKCGHDCLYCSTGTLLRMHPAFLEAGENPFEFGYSIVDPTLPNRVAEDARRIRLSSRGMIQLSTIVDAWSPEAQSHDIGRRCLTAILAEPGWTVRILTKNAAVTRDFDIIERHRDRVLVGLSLTATPAKADRMLIVEPHASPIPERLAALDEAHRRGLRTYAMFCPILPTIADGARDIDELVDLALAFGAEDFFVEPVNARGRGLILTAAALRAAGYSIEADAVDEIRRRNSWSSYTRRLLSCVQSTLRSRGVLNQLRYLLYRSSLTPADFEFISLHDDGVRWLGA